MEEEKLTPEKDKKTGRFVSGNIGGPGRGKGSRNKLGEQFLSALQEDFEEHGAAAIETVRTEKPDQYLKVIASTLPRDLNVNINKFDELSDDELQQRLRELHKTIGPFIGAEGDGGDSGGTEPPTAH